MVSRGGSHSAKCVSLSLHDLRSLIGPLAQHKGCDLRSAHVLFLPHVQDYVNITLVYRASTRAGRILRDASCKY